MKGSYCYLPILRARGGHFGAVRWLSPEARSRLAPLFDLPAPTDKQLEDLPSHLSKRADGISRCWTRDRPCYIDAHDFPLEIRVDGHWPIVYLFEALWMRGFTPVAVTGTEPERGRDYVHAVRNLAIKGGNGACVRVERDEIMDLQALHASLSETLEILELPPSQVDLILDLGFVGDQTDLQLASPVLDAVRLIDSIGIFRNLVLAGGSVPEKLPKKDAGVIRKDARIELVLWERLIAAGGSTPISFGDFGVISAQYVQPNTPVRVPSRIRYTTYRDHVFLRGERNAHPDLCRQLVASEHFISGAYSAGDRQIALSARGLAKGGNPESWVRSDLNHHLELVVEQVWGVIRRNGQTSRYSFPQPVREPWLQADLLEQ